MNGTTRAIKSAEPIAAPDVAYVVEQVTKTLKSTLSLHQEDIFMLGSATKDRGLFNDIDIGVVKEGLTVEALAKAIKASTTEMKVMPGLQIVSLAWPFKKQNEMTVRYCQVDIILATNHNFAKWVYHSPVFSAYKGVHRNMVLMALAAALPRYTHKMALGKDKLNVPVEWTTMSLDLRKGLILRRQSCEGKTGRPVKTKRTIGFEVLSLDPQYITECLLGALFSISNTDSVESLIEAIQSRYFCQPEKRDKILRDSAQRMTDLGLEIPQALSGYSVVSLKKALKKDDQATHQRRSGT